MTADQERQPAAWMRGAQRGDQAGLCVATGDADARHAAIRARRVGAVPWIDDVVQETLLAVHGARQRTIRRAVRAVVLRDRVEPADRCHPRERRVTSREVTSDVLPERGAGAGERRATRSTSRPCTRRWRRCRRDSET